MPLSLLYPSFPHAPFPYVPDPIPYVQREAGYSIFCNSGKVTPSCAFGAAKSGDIRGVEAPKGNDNRIV